MGGGPADPPNPTETPPPHPTAPALPGQEEVGFVADGGREQHRVVPQRRVGFGAVTAGGGDPGIEGPPKRPVAPGGVGVVTIPYLVASSATSTRLSSTEQLNSNSSAKTTWGGGGGEGRWGSGWGGLGGAPRLLPWPWSGTRGNPHCTAADAPPAPRTPASLRCHPAGSRTAWGGVGAPGAPGAERTDAMRQRGLISPLGSTGASSPPVPAGHRSPAASPHPSLGPAAPRLPAGISGFPFSYRHHRVLVFQLPSLLSHLPAGIPAAPRTPRPTSPPRRAGIERIQTAPRVRAVRAAPPSRRGSRGSPLVPAAPCWRSAGWRRSAAPGARCTRSPFGSAAPPPRAPSGGRPAPRRERR